MERVKRCCNNCGIELMDGNHYKNRNMCKTCSALASKKAYLIKHGRFEEAEQISVVTKHTLTDEEKAERKKQTKRLYRERNRESINAKKKEVYYSKQDYFIAKQKEYYRENKPEINKRITEKRRAKRSNEKVVAFDMFLQGIMNSITKQEEKRS